MTKEEFMRRVVAQLGFTPTADQEQALRVLTQFMADRGHGSVMVMKGAAGTGKTSLAGAVIRTLSLVGQKLVLLAPTGRAAKVLSAYSGHRALTIHRKIYRERSFASGEGQFLLQDNLHADTLFLVDECSMIANQSSFENLFSANGGGYMFGSGRLLDDLVRYVYGGRNCRMWLIGDAAQLPPIGEEVSPALDSAVLGGYGLQVYACDMTQVLRQRQDSGILYNATLVRQLLATGVEGLLPALVAARFADIKMISGSDFVEQLENSYRQVGMEETMVVVRSNKQAIRYNMGIRNRVLDREEELASGDWLMIAKNHYGAICGNKDTERPPFDFLANGDRCVVQRVRRQRTLYDFTFADVWLQFPDYDNYEVQTTVVIDSLYAEAPALSKEQVETLRERVLEDYADVPTKAERMRCLRDDVHYNALQVKFAYAVTCHKAQGGQWEHVYVDQGYVLPEMMTADYYHWLYTAFTRASSCLYIVNWPKQ